jgi:hypothetical protein
MAVTKKYLMLNGRQTQKKETYLRDKSGKMKLIERYDSTGSFVEEKEIYKYDNQGLLTMLTHFQREPVSDTSKAVSPPKMRIDQTINYFYDVMKRMTEVKHFTGKAKTPRQVETYQYDPVGNMIEYSDNRAPQGGKITITYDAKNSVVFCEFRNSTGVLIRSVGSTYASHENLVQEIDSDLQGKDLIKHKKIYKYKYFKDDNISGSEVFIGTNRIEKISYIYEFYPKVP